MINKKLYASVIMFVIVLNSTGFAMGMRARTIQLKDPRRELKKNLRDFRENPKEPSASWFSEKIDEFEVKFREIWKFDRHRQHALALKIKELNILIKNATK